jgi:hypothetical protein
MATMSARGGDDPTVRQLDAILAEPWRFPDIPSPAWAVVDKDTLRVELVDWRDAKVPMALRRTALANAQMQGVQNATPGKVRDSGRPPPWWVTPPHLFPAGSSK